MSIVDMPGYGFAKASKKKIKEWTDLSKFYLQNRPNLRRGFFID
jgi:GTP-binding protein